MSAMQEENGVLWERPAEGTTLYKVVSTVMVTWHLSGTEWVQVSWQRVGDFKMMNFSIRGNLPFIYSNHRNNKKDIEKRLIIIIIYLIEKTIASPNNTCFVHIIIILHIFSIYHRKEWGRWYIRHNQLFVWRMWLREALFVSIIMQSL